MEYEINGELFITEDNRLIIKQQPMLECERIWTADQIERQNRIDQEELKSLPNKIKIEDKQNLFDAREQEYNRRLIVDGEKLAKEWLENEKRNSTLD